MENRRILLLMKNKSGALNKVSGLFQKRGINIENITAGKSYPSNIVRMTISGFWDEYTVNQVIVQAEKLFDVELIKEFSEDILNRELVLIKIKINSDKRSELLELLELYRGSVIDVSLDNIVVEVTGSTNKIDGFINLVENFGILEVARTGVIAMSRGFNM
ncbi:MAG: acetolactate synthase small subunit [Fusobacteriaceae bacterium]